MNTENLTALKIHKLTQEQYDRELEAGRIDANAIYLTPYDDNNANIFVQPDEPVGAEEGTLWYDTDEPAYGVSGGNVDLTGYATEEYVDKAIAEIDLSGVEAADNVYVQAEEPVDAEDGAVWIDLDEDGSEGATVEIEVDDTLSQTGMAADAKAVGDALAEKQPVGDYALKSELSSYASKSELSNYALKSELSGGTSSGITMDTLFTNSSLSSSFSARNVTVSDLANYDEFRVECYVDSGIEQIGAVRITETVLNNNGEVKTVVCCTIANGGSVYQAFRYFVFSGTRIQIDDCYITGDTGTSVTMLNTMLIPTRIIGIKYNVVGTGTVEELPIAEEMMFG